jgi:hypothetical protein
VFSIFLFPTESYYADRVYYANIVFRVMMQKGEYVVPVAEDSLSVSFQLQSALVPSTRRFSGKSWAIITVRAALACRLRRRGAKDAKKEGAPKEWSLLLGLGRAAGGAAKLEVHRHSHPWAVSTSTITLSAYKVKGKKGEWYVQCDCIVLVTVKKAEKRTQAEVEVETSYVDLFGIDSSQSQRSDDPPSPPPCRLKKRHSEDREVSHAVDGDDGDDDDNDIDDEDNDNDGGGK